MGNEKLQKGFFIFLGFILVAVSFYCWATLDNLKEIEIPLWQTSAYVTGGLAGILTGITFLTIGFIKKQKN